VNIRLKNLTIALNLVSHFKNENQPTIQEICQLVSTSISFPLKISIAHKGRFVSDSTRDKIRNFNLGKKHSEETKLRMSLSHKGKNTWMKGSKLSEETKLKISKSNIGKHSMKRTKILI